jgi:hypothetical protein
MDSGAASTQMNFSVHSYAISDEELKLGIRSLAVPVAGSAPDLPVRLLPPSGSVHHPHGSGPPI